jgi:hypothetical protein
MMTKNNSTDPHLMKVERPKVSGLNHLWDGPLDKSGYPKEQGSSSGKNGMKLKMADCGCNSYLPGPITQRAKRR